MLVFLYWFFVKEAYHRGTEIKYYFKFSTNLPSNSTKLVPVRSISFVSITLSNPLMIAIPVSTIMRPRVFLNQPSDDDTSWRRWIKLLPHRITNNSILAIPNAYSDIDTKPLINDAGKITATINAYVGLQLLNTGHNEAPRSISQRVHHIFLDLESRLPDFVIHVQIATLSQTWGNIITNPKHIKIIAEMFFQTWLLIPAQATLILSKRVNAMIEITNDHKIVKILFRESDSRLLPQMTGIIGKAQGARIVNIPAKNDII